MRRHALILVAAVSACGQTDPAGGGDAAAPGADAASAVDAAGGADAAPGGDTGSSHACAPQRTAGHQTFSCPEGVEAEVEVSAACLSGGCGVIADVHGYTMTADQLDQHTRMRALAPPRGYVVVQPSAPGTIPSWGTGEHDDVVWDLIEATAEVFDADPDRIHVTGFSQGGMMSFRQLCAHADRLASVAPVAGGGCFDGSGTPAVEVPILYIHGHGDPIVSWSLVAVPQRDAVLAAWDFGPPEVIASGAHYTATRWTTTAGTRFELWEHDYTTGDLVTAGHCLPGPDDNLTFRCDASEFDEATAVLDFFDAHHLGD